MSTATRPHRPRPAPEGSGLDTIDLQKIALEALCDSRSVGALIRGERNMRPTTKRRIVRAMRDLGYAMPPQGPVA